MTDLLDLPPELLQQVSSVVQAEDLTNLRLVCKSLCDNANEVFAIKRLSTRVNTISESSLSALVEMTAHPVFGRYIKEVTLSVIRTAPILDKREHERDWEWKWAPFLEEHMESAFITSGDCGRLLHQAFTNVKQHGSHITIGISDGGLPSQIDGESPTLGLSRIAASHDHETFDLVTSAAQMAGCPVNGLRVKLERPSSFTLPSDLYRFLRYHPECSLDLESGDLDGDCGLVYDHRTYELTVKGLVYCDCIEPYWPVLTQWLVDIHVKKFRVEHSDFITYDLHNYVLGPHAQSLEAIELDSLYLDCDQDWETTMLLISAFPNLRCCSITNPEVNWGYDTDFLYFLVFSRGYSVRFGREELAYAVGEAVR